MPRANERTMSPQERRFVQQHADGQSRAAVAYAKWIHSRDEEPDHRGQTLATRSHEVIRHWARERKAVPATVASRRSGDGGAPRVLRFDFPLDAESRDGRLKHIGWDAWLEVFDDRELVFLYQETRANGRQSNFFRLDSPERKEEMKLAQQKMHGNKK